MVRVSHIGIEGAVSEKHSKAPLYAVNNSAQVSLLSLRYALKEADISVAEEAFENDGRRFEPGSLLIARVDDGKLRTALAQFDLAGHSLDSKPNVRTHPYRQRHVSLSCTPG